MEIFAFKFPQRFHCKIKSYNVFICYYNDVLQDNSECPAYKDYWNTHLKINEFVIP